MVVLKKNLIYNRDKIKKKKENRNARDTNVSRGIKCWEIAPVFIILHVTKKILSNISRKRFLQVSEFCYNLFLNVQGYWTLFPFKVLCETDHRTIELAIVRAMWHLKVFVTVVWRKQKGKKKKFPFAIREEYFWNNPFAISSQLAGRANTDWRVRGERPNIERFYQQRDASGTAEAGASACGTDSRSGHAGQSPGSLTPRETGLTRWWWRARSRTCVGHARNHLVAEGVCM